MFKIILTKFSDWQGNATHGTLTFIINRIKGSNCNFAIAKFTAGI